MSPPTRAVIERVAPPLEVRDRERYEVLAEHGRGGLGRVSRAHDKQLGRDVAIKELIKRGDAREVRFVREALITARLEHPGVVPVHEAGCWADGTPFYAMKLVSGRPLKDLIEERTTVHARLGLLPHVIAVADAIAYAHGRRIIHRDLKPGNVIIGEFGETIVIDWGLAKDLSAIDEPALDHGPYRTLASNDLTATGSVLGTPAYMAPEQARGEPVDERVDVFAIGAMLWELCTRTRVPPDDAPRRHRVLRREGIDHDLATIVTKALAPEPRDRYPNAAALATDLKAFHTGARIGARNYSLLQMLAHWARRQRRLAISAVAILAIALVGIIWFVHNIAAERDRADASASDAHAHQRRAEQITDELTLQHAELQLRGDPTAAMATLAGYRGTDVTRLRLLRAEAAGRGVATATVRPHAEPIIYLASEATGGILSVARDRTLRLTRDGATTTLASDLTLPPSVAHARDARLFAYGTASGIALLALPTRTTTRIDGATPTAMDILADGSRLAAVTTDGSVTVWSLVPSAVVLHRETPPGPLDVLFPSPDRLIVQTRDALRRIWLDAPHPADAIALSSRSLDANTAHVVAGDERGAITLLSPGLTVLSRVTVCQSAVLAVNLVPNSNVIAFACEDGTCGVVRHDDAGAKLTVGDVFGTSERATRAMSDALGRQILVSDDSSFVYIYDIASRLVTRYVGQPAQVFSVAPATKAFPHILVGDVSGNIRIWDPPRHDARIVMRASDAVFGVMFSPDGKSLLANVARGALRELRIADGAVTELVGHDDSVLRALYSDDGRSIVSYSGDRTLRTWRAADGAPMRVVADHASTVEGVGYIEAGKRIVSIGDDGRMLAWSPEGNDLALLFTRPMPLTALEVLRDTDHLIVKDGSSAIWDVAPDGSARQVRPADGATVTVLRASLDGRLVATGTDRGAVVVYDTANWTVRRSLTVGGAVRQIRFDPRDRDLLVASRDDRVRAVALGEARRLPWSDLPIAARNLDYSPDGETLAIVCPDGGSWFYELSSDTWAYTMDHASEIFSAAFSPDGAQFASSDRRGKVTIRDIAATFAAARKR